MNIVSIPEGKTGSKNRKKEPEVLEEEPLEYEHQTVDPQMQF